MSKTDPPQQQNDTSSSISQQNLLDFNWLQARLVNTSAYQLIQDFIPYLEDETIQLIHGALQATIHILSHDNSALRSQLFGRLQELNSPEIQHLLAQAEASSDDTPHDVWLRPLTQSLKSPLDPLLFTLYDDDNPSVKNITITPDGNHLISYGTHIKIWDLTFQKKAFILESDYTSHHGVVITPDNQYLIANSRHSFQAWHLPTQQKADSILPSNHLVHERYNRYEGEFPIFLSPNGQILALRRNNHIILIKLFSNDEPLVLASKELLLEVAAFAPNSQHVLAGSAEGNLNFWNLEDPYDFVQIKGEQPFCAIAINDKKSLAISAMSDQTLIVWDLQEKRAQYSLSGHKTHIRVVTFTPDGQFAISSSGKGHITLWDLTQKTIINTIDSHDSYIGTLICTPDGRKLISQVEASHIIRIWDLKKLTSKSIAKQPLPSTYHAHINNLTITPDGQKAISTAEDGTIKIWDANSGAHQHTLTGHTDAITCAVVTADSKKLLSASKDGSLKVWDVTKGVELKTLLGHEEAVNDVAIVPSTNKAISASDDKTVKVWDLNNGQEILSLTGHTKPIHSIAVTSDGRYVISTDDDAKIWDLSNGKELFIIEYCRQHSYRSGSNYLDSKSISITPDGTTVITNNIRRWPSLKLWNIVDGTESFAINVEDAEDHGKFTTFTTTIDGKQLMAGDLDGVVRIFSQTYDEVIHKVVAHKAPIDILTIMPDGKRFVTGSCDHSLKVWDIASGQLVTSFYGDGAFISCVVTPCGTIIAAEDTGRLHFLQLMEKKQL